MLSVLYKWLYILGDYILGVFCGQVDIRCLGFGWAYPRMKRVRIDGGYCGGEMGRTITCLMAWFGGINEAICTCMWLAV